MLCRQHTADLLVISLLLWHCLWPQQQGTVMTVVLPHQQTNSTAAMRTSVWLPWMSITWIGCARSSDLRRQTTQAAPQQTPCSGRLLMKVQTCEQMAVAVALLSPVTTMRRMPAALHSLMAPLTSFLGGSCIPTIPIHVRSASSSLLICIAAK